MKKYAPLIILCATPLGADMICSVQDETCSGSCPQTAVQFSIDPSQFVDPQDPNDPPRQQITQVTMDAQQFRAHAIMMEGGIIGFHNDSERGSTLMLVQKDGAPRHTVQPDNRNLASFCVTN